MAEVGTKANPLDLRKLEPEEAARKLHEWVCARARESRQDPGSEVFLWDPDESQRKGFGRAWRVCWEAGPFEWAIAVSLGESYLAPESDYAIREPEVLVCGARHYIAEPYHAFDLGFYPN